MPDTPNSPYGNYSVDDIAAQIKVRRPDLAQHDNSELVRTLIQHKPQFQTYLSTDALQKLSTPTPGLFDFLKQQGSDAVQTAKGMLLDPLMEPWKSGYRDPVSYAQALVEQFGGAAKEGFNSELQRLQAAQTKTENAKSIPEWLGGGAEQITHALGLVPGVGPVAVNAAEHITTGEPGKAAGELATLFLPGMAEHAVRGAFRPEVNPYVSRNIPGVPEPAGGPLSRPAPTETAPLPSTQAPPVPQTFTGLDSPMRPYDPTGQRFQRGGTPGLPTITGEPPTAQAPVVSPADHIAASGMVNRGQLMKNEGPFGVEHPDFRNVTASINPQDVTSPDAVKQAVARKLNEVADNPPGPVPGQPALDPVALRNAAQQLQPSQGRPTPTPDAAQLNLPDYKPSEKATSLAAPRTSLGPEFEAGQLTHEITRNKAILESGASAEEKQIASARLVESGGLPTGADRPAGSNPSIQNAPQPVRSFDLERFHNQMDAVETAESSLTSSKVSDYQRERYWQPALEKLRSDFKSGLTDTVRNIAPDARDSVRDQLTTESARIREQIKEIQDVRTQHPIAQELRQEMRGAEGRKATSGTEQFAKLKGTPIQIVGTQTKGVLNAIHDALGDTTKAVVDPVASEQRNRLIEAGKNPDEAIPEGYRRLTSEEWQKTKTGLIAEQKKLKAELQARLEQHLRDRVQNDPTLPAKIQSGELTAEKLKASSFKEVLEEQNAEGESYKDRISELDKIIGRNPTKEIYAGKGKPVTDETGVVRAPGTIKGESLELWRQWTGKQLRKIPDEAVKDKFVSNMERRASFLDTISRKLTPTETSTTINGSGESAASLEAINRSASERQQGTTRVRIDTRSGRETPLIGADAVDAKAGPYDRIVQRTNGRETTLDEGLKARPSRPGLGTTSYAGLPFLDPALLGSVIPDSVKTKTAEVLGDLGREVRNLGFDTAKNAYSVGESLVNAVSPKTGVDADTVNLLFKMKGDIAKEAFLAPKLLESYRRTAEALPDEARIDFIDRYKQGIHQATPELQALADTIKQIDRQDFSDIQQYRPGVPFLENHFRLLYKVIPGRDEAGFTSFVGKRPLSGGGGFLHQHTFDTLSEAMQAGGEPVTTNPVDLFLLSHQNVTRFVEANKMWEDAQYKNLRQYVQKGMTAPSNFVRLSDPISKVFFRAASGEGLVNPGEWWVEKGFGRLLENYLSRDRIRESVLGKLVVDTKNIATGVELFGPFHAVFVNNAMASMELGNSLQRVWNLGVRKGDVGEVARGTKEAATAAVDFVRGPSGMLSAGRAVISGKSLPESLLPGPYAEGSAIKEFGTALEKSRRLNDPQALQDFVNSDRGQKFLQKFPGAEGLFNDVFQGGLNVNLDEGMRSNVVKRMHEAFEDKRRAAGVAKMLPAALYTAMRPLFDEYIPNLKLGMFMRDMSLQLKDRAPEILNGSLTREELSRQVARRTENVFGEMNFDNLFWNRTMKTSLQMLYRSVTWRFGTLDVAKNALLGQGSAIVDAAKTRTLPRIDPNAAYFAGEMLLTGALAAVTMRALSGKNPASVQDLLHPQTGEVDERGKPIRVDIPTYLSKNISGMVQDFPQGVIKYATGGRSTPIQKFLESWNNKDFYGKFVANPNDPEYSQFVQRVVHLLPSLMVTGTMDRLEQEGAGPGRKLLAFGGYTPTPRGLDLTPAEKKAQELMSAKLPAGGRYDYDFNHSNTMKRVIAGIRNEQDVSQTILDGLQSGTLKIDDLKPTKLLPRLTQPYLAQMSRRLSLEEFLTVYDKATPQEREQLNPLITTKLGELLKMDPTRRDQTVSRLKSLTQ